MKVVYLAFSLIFLQCQTNYLVYQRNSFGLNEQLEINTQKGVFFYQADSSRLEYKAKGRLELVDSMVYLEFPENAEVNLLSPFKKGYYELVKSEESIQTEIEIQNYDVRTMGKLSLSRHFPPRIEVLSFEDSALVKKVSYPLVQLQEIGTKVLLRSKVSGYFDQYIVIPGNGHYQLKLFLQPMQTFVSYETTTSECYRVVTGPIFCFRTIEIENKLIKKLSPDGESFFSYPWVKSPYSLVGIEKRKMRLFQ